MESCFFDTVSLIAGGRGKYLSVFVAFRSIANPPSLMAGGGRLLYLSWLVVDIPPLSLLVVDISPLSLRWWWTYPPPFSLG